MFQTAPAKTIQANTATAVPRKPTPAEIAAKLSVGLVLHDNANALTEGWAFLPGNEPFRVRGLYDLPNDAMWISNGDFQNFRRLGSAQYHHVRRTGYLGLKLNEIANDLGVRIDGGHAIEGGREISHYVQSTVRTAVEAYRIEEPLKSLQEDTLLTTISKLQPPVAPSKESLAPKLASAYQSWSARYVSYLDNTVLVRLRFSRLHYAKWLLSQSVPDSGWSHIYSSQGFDHDAVMSGKFNPTLIEAVLEFDSVSADVAELIAYGSGGNNISARSKRAWMTDVEYRWISQHARIHVLSYLIANTLSPLPAACMLPPQILDDAKIFGHMHSVGLLSYIHWQALVTPKWSRLTGKSDPDQIATWLRAYDRAKCFEAAFVFQQSGFHVTGYGNGSVMVKAEREKVHDLLDLAESIGIAHPTRRSLLLEFGYASPDDTY